MNIKIIECEVNLNPVNLYYAELKIDGVGKDEGYGCNISISPEGYETFKKMFHKNLFTTRFIQPYTYFNMVAVFENNCLKTIRSGFRKFDVSKYYVYVR